MAASLGLEATNSLLEHEALTSADAPLDAPKIRRGFEICEVIAAWPELPEALRAAVLAIVRTHAKDSSTVERRQTSNGREAGEGVP
jgi:hypothetical protein